MFGVHELEGEQLEAAETLRLRLKGARNKTDRGRRALAYIRSGELVMPKLARQVQRRALRQRTPDSLHVYVARCRRGINKLGFTRNPARRLSGLKRKRYGWAHGYEAVWAVQRGNARQIEMWSHAIARAIAGDAPPPGYSEYYRLPAKLLAEIVEAVAGWLGFTICPSRPA